MIGILTHIVEAHGIMGLHKLYTTGKPVLTIRSYHVSARSTDHDGGLMSVGDSICTMCSCVVIAINAEMFLRPEALLSTFAPLLYAKSSRERKCM
jgi:hypothetical protein